MVISTEMAEAICLLVGTYSQNAMVLQIARVLWANNICTHSAFVIARPILFFGKKGFLTIKGTLTVNGPLTAKLWRLYSSQQRWP